MGGVLGTAWMEVSGVLGVIDCDTLHHHCILWQHSLVV